MKFCLSNKVENKESSNEIHTSTRRRLYISTTTGFLLFLFHLNIRFLTPINDINERVILRITFWCIR